jgi:signal transduction histidine kinase
MIGGAGARTGRLTLAAQVAEQVFYATREAVTNAFQHAQASHVSVVLSYRRRAFAVRCNDDGVGFANDAAPANLKKDHWGIRGLQERVARIGGKLKLQSGPMQGTVITILIPASCAYRRNFWWKNLPGLH